MRTAMTESVGAAFDRSAGLTTGSAVPVLVIDDEGRGPTTLRWLADAGYHTAAAIHGDLVPRLFRGCRIAWRKS